MTKIEQIEIEYKKTYNFPDERVVDICCDVVDGVEIVSVIAISDCHIAWKRWFCIEDGELHFINGECI